MRLLPLVVALVLAAPAALSAQQKPVKPRGLPPPVTPPARCCVLQVLDAKGLVFGEVIKFDENHLQTVTMRYRLADGDSVALIVGSEYVLSDLQPGGSDVLFTTPDCSGNDAFVALYKPLLTKRQAVVLPVGSPGFYNATGAWLFVSAALPARVFPPAGTLFHSQWGDTGACSPYPAPGYTYPPSPLGGIWMKRVENLYAKFTRPFYVK